MTDPKLSKNNLRCAHVERGIWLVKAPKYLSEKWVESTDSPEVGRLRIKPASGPGQKSEIIFTSTIDDEPGISSAAAGFPNTPYSYAGSNRSAGAAVPLGKPKTQKMIPKEHKFIVNALNQQTLAVLREDRLDPSAVSEGPSTSLSIEGRVVQRAECRPLGDSVYMKMKVSHIEDAAKPAYFVKQMEKAEVKFKPVAKHVDHMESDRAKKEGAKMVRLDRHQVQDMIFRAFEKHQYYNIKDLCAITQQPYGYLREILTDLCLHNTAPPHKNMWELKPEYRHYSGS